MENLIQDSVEHNLYLRKVALGEIEAEKQGKASLDKPWLAIYSEETISKPVPKTTAYEYLYELHHRIPINTFNILFDDRQTHSGILEFDIVLVAILFAVVDEFVRSLYLLD